MKRFEIISTQFTTDGWVEVADDGTLTYEYNGEDPNDMIVPYLEKWASGEWTVTASAERPDPEGYPTAKIKLVDVSIWLQNREPIWATIYHDDFEHPHG